MRHKSSSASVINDQNTEFNHPCKQISCKNCDRVTPCEWRVHRSIRMGFKTLYVLNFQREEKHIFTFCVIPRHWHDTGSWNASSSKTRTYLFYIINIMGARSQGINIHYSVKPHLFGPRMVRVLNSWAWDLVTTLKIIISSWVSTRISTYAPSITLA